MCSLNNFDFDLNLFKRCEQYLKNWQLFVMRESVREKIGIFWGKKLVIDKYLLREKDNILNLLKRENIWKKIRIYWWIKIGV